METATQPMIKAEELRLGNCVYGINEDSGEKKIVEVGIPELEVADTLQPIPLTPEILEKCGFRKKYIGWQKLPMTVKQWAECFEFNCNGSGIKLYHLHQLQNLYFALTGEELQITL